VFRGGVVVVALLTVLALPGGGAPATTATTVTVRLVAGKAVLSRRSVPTGTVRFVVTGTGRVAHEFVVGGKRTRPLKAGQRQTLVLRFTRAGTYRFVCKRQGRSSGTRGTIRVLAPPAEPPEPAAKLTLVGTFDSPTDIDAPPGDTSRLFVVEQRGAIWLLVDGQLGAEPFLDLRAEVLMNGEAGLLGLAFAPDYAASGLFYVYFNDRSGNLHLVEYRRSADDPNRADPASARELLYQVKFAANHNGGMLQFGPNGLLYVAVGDGGSAPGYKPGQFAQSDTIFGKLLRLDTTTGEYEIWARGLRNPWRFWLDAVTALVYVGDVGQERREEVNVVPVDAPSVNFGWPCFEGTLRFDETETCANVVAPTYEYAHAPGACSITGGVVVRDPRLPWLAGTYLFADFCGTRIQTMQTTGGSAIVAALPFDAPNVISFGVDGLDRVHVGTVTGSVFRLDPAA
jgi:glucose/arabinose dehydrogenase